MGKYNNSDIETLTAITASSAFTAEAAPTYLTGATLNMTKVESGTLSAHCTVDAETNTITIAHQWEVSNDGTTFVVCAPANNAATVVLATGTSGSDATVSKVVDANPAVYGYKYARLQLVTGVASASGTTDIGGAVYHWRKPRF
jgi:hypothetical protein